MSQIIAGIVMLNAMCFLINARIAWQDLKTLIVVLQEQFFILILFRHP